MAQEHPLLSAKVLAVVGLLGFLWAGGMALILAQRLADVGMLMAVMCSAGIVWLYFRPLKLAIITGDWVGEDMPSTPELTIAIVTPIGSFLIAFYLWLHPAKEPHIPTAQENAEAVTNLETAGTKRIGPLEFVPSAPVSPLVMSMPQTDIFPFPFPIPQQSNQTFLRKIDPLAIGQSAIGQASIGTHTLTTESGIPIATEGDATGNGITGRTSEPVVSAVTPFSGLGSVALKLRVERMATTLRAFEKSYDQKRDAIAFAPNAANNAQETHALLEKAQTDEIVEFQKTYLPEIRDLIDEMLTRLKLPHPLYDSDGLSANGRTAFSSGEVDGPRPLTDLADYMEATARKLP